MRRLILLGAAAAALLGLVPHAFAAGWALTVDAPLSFTFNNANASSPAPGNSAATWHNRTTTDVSGSKVLLIAPFHVGVGYEDYSFRSKLDYPTQGGTGVAQVQTNLRIYDLVLDIPMKYLNVTVGYGSGTADTDIEPLGTPGQTSPAPIRNATVTQVFLVLGIPLGARVDVHVGYHRLTIEDKDIVTTGNPGPYDQTQQNGDMLSAGLRLNF
jgi:hypothetical protein